MKEKTFIGAGQSRAQETFNRRIEKPFAKACYGDAKSYSADPENFYGQVRKQYGVNRDKAEKHAEDVIKKGCRSFSRPAPKK